jgi:prephenate dehydrogenase
MQLRQCSWEEHGEQMKNIQHEPNNMALKLDHIWANRRHMDVENYARINNIASIHFNYQLFITIWPK